MKGIDTNKDAWVRSFHPASADSVRLVCFPHAGGSASFFFPVARALRSSAEVLAIQYPGRQDRRHEPCVTDLHSLADLACEALLNWADRPMIFFGHSMGAVVAFEVARRLEEDPGAGPAAVLASGRRAPSRRREESVHRHDDDGVIQELRLLGGTNSVFLQDEELLAMSLPSIRGDYEAIERYVCPPGAMVRCPVTAMVGDADPRTTIDEARAWSEHTSSGFDLRVFPGGHFYLTAQQNQVIDVLFEKLRALSVPEG